MKTALRNTNIIWNSMVESRYQFPLICCSNSKPDTKDLEAKIADIHSEAMNTFERSIQLLGDDTEAWEQIGVEAPGIEELQAIKQHSFSVNLFLSNRLRTCAGYNVFFDIVINAKFHQTRPYKTLRHTYLHELAHFIQFCLWPDKPGHGKKWLLSCLLVGLVDPEVYTDFDE